MAAIAATIESPASPVLLTTGSICLGSECSYDRLKTLIEQHQAQNFMVFGRTTKASGFVWEWIPYPRVSHFIYLAWNQLKVLAAFVFGWKQTLYPHLAKGQKEVTLPDAPCAFCDSRVIEKQRIFAGERVNLLVDYRPLTSLHFLVVPKAHRKDLHTLTREEHSEALLIAQKVAQRVAATPPIKNTYMFHKTGKIAGQGVPHWHLHLVFTQGTDEELWGKLKVLKNILIGSSPLSPEKVEQMRADYHTKLQPILVA